ncbi:MAG: retroviral-like aspartic protease family protein [Verrucomicrobia bacterium]|nr:retroviral-like aspartic protease family protein [Verrucomicrobiota bacterium]
MLIVNARPFPLWIFLASLMVLPNGLSAEVPPLEGPLMRVAIKVTNQRSGEFDWFASPLTGVSGSALPGAITNVAFALLDSGAATHLLSYPDALGLGVQGSYLSGNTFVVSGVDGVSVDVDISMPVGFFVEGLQNLNTNGNPQPSLMFGQGNFAGGVNSADNYDAGIDTPTVIGAPFLLFFPAYIRNSQPVQSSVLGKIVSSPSITFYDGPANPQIPTLAHRIYLETRPTGSPAVGYLGEVNDDFEVIPSIPSVILAGLGGGSLFFTASAMTFREGTNSSSGKVVVDTGAQATLISEVAAAELGLNVQNPEFEIEVQGLVNTVTAPGFYVDSASIPAGFGSPVSWSHIPVVVLNVGSPEGGTLYGILGSNLTAARDMVFNGAASTPYLDVTDPIVLPRIRITTIRSTGPNSAEIDWYAEPAPPVLYLETCTNLALVDWKSVATNTLSTINGTFSVTGLGSRNFFRLQAP